MQTATLAAGNQAGLDCVEDPAAGLMSVVADLMSLIIHVQATARLIEAEIQRDLGIDAGNETADVVILDDVTPCYAAASATLNACNAGLDAALQLLLGILSEAKKPALRQASSRTNPRERATRPSSRPDPRMRSCASRPCP